MRQYRIDIVAGRVVATDIEQEKNSRAAGILVAVSAAAVSLLFVVELMIF